MITLGGCNIACGDDFERVWGSTVVRALQALGDKLALEDASSVALAVGVTRIPQMPGGVRYPPALRSGILTCQPLSDARPAPVKWDVCCYFRQ
jgi:hypothetical protein